jgi:predicted transcriptional regulator
MATITVEISGAAAEKLQHLVDAEQRSEAQIVRDALEAYAPRERRLPKGAGKYRSGRSDTSHNVDQILKDAVKEGKWPDMGTRMDATKFSEEQSR